MGSKPLLCLLLIALALAHAPGASLPDPPRSGDQLSPFQDISFQDDGTAMVLIDGVWWQWLALDGIPYTALCEAADTIGPWQKRLAEDLTATLAAAGHTPDEQVVLTLRSDEGGAAVQQTAVMTADNRSLIRDHRSLRERATPAPWMTCEESLRRFGRLLRRVHAYSDLLNVDIEQEIEREIATWGAGADPEEFVLSCQRLICLLGDGHAGVDSWADAVPPGRSPFVFATAEGRVVCLRSGGEAFAADQAPFVVSIDGVEIEEWMVAASRYVPRGSPQLVQRRAARLLGLVGLLRADLGLPDGPVRYVLEGPDGRISRVEVPVSVDPPRGLPPLGRPSGPMSTTVGYVRVLSMALDDEEVAEIIGTFHALGGHPYIILDIRGNGGGGRELLYALAPSLFPPGDHAIVYNVARGRIGPALADELPTRPLSNRGLAPQGWSGWTDTERAAIDRFREGFEPEHRVRDESFTDWQYGVLSASARTPRYTGRVVVLMDDGCFSASDIFAAAMGEFDAVRLVGMPTSGGSARSRKWEVPGTELEVRLATMVSYQPNGQLFDGHGVVPDFRLDRSAEDLLAGQDAQLSRLVELLERDPGRLFH